MNTSVLLILNLKKILKLLMTISIVAPVLIVSGCMSTSSLQNGKSLGNEGKTSEWVMSFNAPVADYANAKQRSSSLKLLVPDISYRHSVTNDFDLGGRLFGLGLEGAGMQVFGKYQLFFMPESRVAVSAGMVLAFGRYAHSEGGADFEVKRDIGLPLYISYDLSPDLDLYATPTYLFRKYSYEAQFGYDEVMKIKDIQLIGSAFGIGWKPFLFEVFVARSITNRDAIYEASIGLRL